MNDNTEKRCENCGLNGKCFHQDWPEYQGGKNCTGFIQAINKPDCPGQEGEFTKEMRRKWHDMTIQVKPDNAPLSASLSNKLMKDLYQACDLIDRLTARQKLYDEEIDRLTNKLLRTEAEFAAANEKIEKRDRIIKLFYDIYLVGSESPADLATIKTIKKELGSDFAEIIKENDERSE